jgi:hypothetical protein
MPNLGAAQKIANPVVTLYMFGPALCVGRGDVQTVIFFGHEFLALN